ncbi:MAG: hypothetical protein AB8B73_09755 [Ekhidna sp.]
MKTLFTLSVLFGALFIGAPTEERTNPELEMGLSMEEIFQEKIIVYDYKGNLLKELKIEDVATDRISVTDHFFLDKSDFAFEHMGDYYYFKED